MGLLGSGSDPELGVRKPWDLHCTRRFKRHWLSGSHCRQRRQVYRRHRGNCLFGRLESYSVASVLWNSGVQETQLNPVPLRQAPAILSYSHYSPTALPRCR